MKILGPVSVIWYRISEIWPQKGQPGNLDYNMTIAIDWAAKQIETFFFLVILFNFLFCQRLAHERVLQTLVV